MTGTNNAGIPFLTTDQMREVDRAMIDDYGIHLIQMMENAGRNLAHLARRRFLDSDPQGRRVLVLAGTGGNGGGGLVCARHLHNWGANVSVWTTAPADRLTKVPRHQLSVLQRMDVDLVVADENARLPDADLIIDAIIGYSLSGDPRGPSASLIRAANGHGAPVLALDAPSGIDTAAGTVHDPSINATATMTLALPKEGLRSESAKKHVGELYLADISVPPKLYGDPPLNLAVGAIFAQEEVLRIW
jgi:NAD(P)H-hydrate epimerase